MINYGTQLCMLPAGRPGNFGMRFHDYLYEKLGLNFIYKAFTTQDIEVAVKGVRALRVHSCAISVPFKESYMPFLDVVDPSVEVIDSVDTIINDNGTLTGFNTDYIAVKNLITSRQLDNHACVMIRGNGGMSKTVITASRDTGFRDVTIAARNRESGPALAEQYGFQWQPQPEGVTCDILVNVTPVGMAGGEESDELAYGEAMITVVSVVFDVATLSLETPVIKLVQRLGKKTISGAEMIALQAVEQLTMHTGVRPGDELIAEAAEFARAG